MERDRGQLGQLKRND